MGSKVRQNHFPRLRGHFLEMRQQGGIVTIRVEDITAVADFHGHDKYGQLVRSTKVTACNGHSFPVIESRNSIVAAIEAYEDGARCAEVDDIDARIADFAESISG